ncbi:MAG TPA: glycine--tRNA ligase [Nocardioidaceae bacterium]|jgi:glycyl-tRNA synthetase|nr:glycine--tRNA ligase [Nocardioidaceae bacterium]
METRPVPADRFEAVVSLCKRRGFVYPCGEIYGGTRSAWDYGPLGVELKENLRRQWWRTMVQSRDDVVGIDSSVILPSQVWEASGHLDAFVDPLVECQSCHRRFREDHLLEDYARRKQIADLATASLDAVACPNCGTKHAWTEPRMFNGLLKTHLGPVESDEGLHYLRPETAQGIFVNFLNVMNSARKKPPFGIAQTGKGFRNEITPGNFIFRTREFEMMELEFFVEPGTDEQWHDYWLQQRRQWYVDLGIAEDNLRFYEHPQEKLSHYSTRTVDIEYRFGIGNKDFDELEGIANRTDYDLSTHTKHSGFDLSYFDQDKGERWVPYVIEPAAGLTRATLAFLLDAYAEDEAPNAKGGIDKRVVLRLDPRLAPVKAAVLPLSRNPDLSPKAKALAAELRSLWNVDFDDAGAIGRRYRRQDEIGTPYCVTVDFDSLDDDAVTVRERDSMAQDRIGLSEVRSYLAERMPGC